MADVTPEATIGQTKEAMMNRKLLWAVFAIGLALVIAPFALGRLPGKTAAGQRMMNGFQPIMQRDQVTTTARYYNQVFVPLGRVTPMIAPRTSQSSRPISGVSAACRPTPPSWCRYLHRRCT